MKRGQSDSAGFDGSTNMQMQIGIDFGFKGKCAWSEDWWGGGNGQEARQEARQEAGLQMQSG